MKLTSIIATAALAGLSLTQTFAAPTIFSRGHIDMGITFEDGAFDLHVHSEGYDLEAEADAAVLRVLPQTQVAVPNDPQFAFLGAPGTPIWVLPQDEPTATSLNVLVLGIGAEESNPADFVGDLSVKLTNVVFTPEPGGSPTANVSIFKTGLAGAPTVIMSTHDGLDAADVASVTPGTHFDPNWAFSKPGRYVLTFDVSGTRTTAGNPVVADSASYTFVVKSTESASDTQVQAGEPIVVGAGAGLITSLTPVAVAPDRAGLFFATLKKFGANTALIDGTNDRALLRVSNYLPEILAREGDALVGLPGSKIKSFTDANTSADGTIIVNASLLSGAGGILPTNDLALSVLTPSGLLPVIREGDAAPGLSGYNFISFASYLPADNGYVIGVGVVRNTTLNLSKTVVFRASADGVQILAATGELLQTDAGPLTVKSISRPTRLNLPLGHTGGCVQILINFTDRSSQIVRFAPPQI
jgi:surface-anchored protein